MKLVTGTNSSTKLVSSGRAWLLLRLSKLRLSPIARLLAGRLSVAKLSVAKLSAGVILEAIDVVGAAGEKRCWTLLFWASSFNTLRLKPNR